MASKHLQKVLEDVITAASTQTISNNSVHECIQDLVDGKAKFFSLFKTPLIDNTYPKDNHQKYFNIVNFRDCDVIVGFLAETDASFTLHAGPFSLPVSLKAGELKLAWRGEAPIPNIRFAFHQVWVEDLKGSVVRISACLDSDERRELAQLRSLPLGSEYITASGMVGINRR